MRLLKTAYSFDDVLLVPGFSQVNSRKDIDLSTSISGLKLDIPIISANMSSVTGAEMCIALGKLGGLGILHRMMSIDEMVTAIKSSLSAGARKVGFSFGIGDDWMDRFVAGIEAGASIACLDVAHAHHIRVRKIVETISAQKNYYAFPLIVGNVATADAAIDIRYWYIQNNLHYAKYGELLNPITIKVGIGGGCFIPNTKITTIFGDKNIEDVNIGDLVLTHSGKYQKVVHKFEKIEQDCVYAINDVVCTKNHEFYVINKKYLDIVSDDNLEQLAEWISAEELTSDYMLIEKSENYKYGIGEEPLIHDSLL